jgi:hypothetical protein
VASVVLALTSVPPFTPKAGMLSGSRDDFDVYRDGAYHLMTHRPLYTERLLHEHLYTYFPFSAITFLPFGLLPHRADGYIWMAINVVVLVAIVALCFRMLGYRLTPHLVWISALLAIAFTFVEPVRTTLFYGQINLVLLLVVVWDTSRGERSRIKGIGVGIAAGIKLTPLLAVTVTGMTAVVVSPLAWTHHWVWFVPIIVYTVHRALTRWWAGAAALFIALGAWPYQLPDDPLPRIGFYLFPTWVPWDALVNLYVLLYAVIMIGAAVIAIRTTRNHRHAKADDASSTASIVGRADAISANTATR